MTYQLALMRQMHGPEGQGRQGLHLGAYAWVEDLRPEGQLLEPVASTDPELLQTFGGVEDPRWNATRPTRATSTRRR